MHTVYCLVAILGMLNYVAFLVLYTVDVCIIALPIIQIRGSAKGVIQIQMSLLY
jgi:hypothetical protein